MNENLSGSSLEFPGDSSGGPQPMFCFLGICSTGCTINSCTTCTGVCNGLCDSGYANHCMGFASCVAGGFSGYAG